MPNINRGVEILYVCLPVSPALTGSSSVHHLLRASLQKHTDVCISYQRPVRQPSVGQLPFNQYTEVVLLCPLGLPTSPNHAFPLFI